MNEKRRIIDKSGNVVIGQINNQEIYFNYKDYKLLNFFDKEVKGLKKRLKFHHFNYYAILSEKYVLAYAIIDLGYIKNMFLYLYDYKGKFLVQREIKINPFSKKLVFPINPDKHEISYSNKKENFLIKKDFSDGKIFTKINIKDLSVNFTVKYNNKNSPLKIVVPAGHNGWTFTEKCSNINDFENLSISFKGEELDFKNASLIYDWSGGYLKRETNWVWASFSGLNQDNKLIAANFAAMVNETYETENIYWIEKKSYKEDSIMFNYEKSAIYNPWTLENKAKTIKVKFYPRDEINDDTNALVVKNSFKQFIGKFNGYFIDENNNKIEFQDISGITEIHKALW